MASVILSGLVTTNRDASPRVISNSGLARAEGRWTAGNVTIPAAWSTGGANTSFARLGVVPSNCYIRSMFLFCLAQAAGTVSIGFYQTTANGGLIVGAGTQMQSLLSVAAAVTGAQVAFGNTAIVDYSNIEKQLWQYLGLTADPLIDYDICITPGTAWTNGGITGLITNYTI